MGIYLSSNCNGNTVTNNTANDNHQIGIRIVNYCHKNNITGNTANDISGVGYDQQKGISLYFECDRNTISGNTANNNVEYGIRIVDDCYNNTISGNTANNNVKYGIYLVEDCYNNTISGNTANENGYYGIYLDRCDNNTITGNKNTFNYNGIAGIMLEDCDGNNITDNIANYNGIYGICLNSSSWNNISFNEFIGNQICAFNDLYCVGNEFTNNYCNNRPELSSGSVEPKRGNQNTQFTFFVVYTDLDDDIPIYVNITINGTSYEMDKQYILDDVYTDGCIYNFTITLAPAAHNFTYYFECRDVYTTVTTSNYDNLEVYRTVVTDGGGGGGGGSKQEEIPLGNFPLLFTVMGIVSLVLYYKKKKKIKF